jgi:uncharacterized protein HemY
MKANINIYRISVFLAIALFRVVAAAHTDLELQIQDLSQQIAKSTPDPELLIRRGDLYRRHEDWAGAGRDFELVRKLAAEHPLIDWYEGRYKVQSGHWSEGEQLLSRFLGLQPDHSSAYHERARARWKLGRASAAAQDFEAAITTSLAPGPSLYRSLIIAQVASKDSEFASAMISIDAGLEKFPAELSLLGLGTDLSLAVADVQKSLDYLSRVPGKLNELPQWQFRRAAWACIRGDSEIASRGFSNLLPDAQGQKKPRVGTWHLSPETIRKLVDQPLAGTCAAVALELIRIQQP